MITTLIVLAALQSGWTGKAGSATGGGLSASPEESTRPDIDMDAAGTIAVVWSEMGPLGWPSLRVKRFTEATAKWEDLSAGLSKENSDFVIPSPRIRIGPAGTLFVAWIVGSPFSGGDIWLKKWDGTAWVELGGSATEGVSRNGGLLFLCSLHPALVLDAAGLPAVAWITSSVIHYRKWDGTTWTDLANSGVMGVGPSFQANQLNMVLDSAGHPWIAWLDGLMFFDVQNVHLVRWDGTTWAEVGESATGLGLGTFGMTIDWGHTNSPPGLAIDGLGRVSVAWAEVGMDADGPTLVRVRRWNGVQWSDLGDPEIFPEPLPAVFEEGRVSLAASPTQLLAVWSQYSLETMNEEIRAKLWDDVTGAWNDIDGSAIAGGVSATAKQSRLPTAAFTTHGMIAVAWQELTGALPEIYVKTNIVPEGLAAMLLKQEDDKGATVGVGYGLLQGSILKLGALAFSGDQPKGVLEFEVRRVGVPFTGQATHVAADVAWGTSALVLLEEMAPGDYHWRARVKVGGEVSLWSSFGKNGEDETDFVIYAPTPVVFDEPDGESAGSSGCGATAGMSTGLLAFVAAALACLRRSEYHLRDDASPPCRRAAPRS